VQATVKALPFIALFFILSGFAGDNTFLGNAMEYAPFAVLAIFGGIAAGTIMVPLLLPWLPGRALSMKGFSVGLVTILCLLLVTGRVIPGSPAGLAETLAWLLMATTISSWLGMNFTGATTYTSRSGVRKEMLRAIPIQFTAVLSGFICWLGSCFYF
jgi:acetyl-CoA decarbonylase/synthase complex subunit gamma